MNEQTQTLTVANIIDCNWEKTPILPKGWYIGTPKGKAKPILFYNSNNDTFLAMSAPKYPFFTTKLFEEPKSIFKFKMNFTIPGVNFQPFPPHITS